MDCIFCKIIKGEIPSYKIYEDEYTFAFLDINPVCDGHTLVIPKNHCTNILDADSKTISHVMETVKLISNHYVNDCGFAGVNVMNANNEAAEQSVFHLHMHIIPRMANNKDHMFPASIAKDSPANMHKILKMGE